MNIYQSIKHKFLLIFQHILFDDFVIFSFYYEFLGIHRVKLDVFSSSV